MKASGGFGCAALLVGSLLGGCTPMLRAGDRAFEMGDCRQALVAYSRILNEGLPTRHLDRVLFQAGLCVAQSGSASFDRERARQYLTRLVRAYPQSPWALPARLLLERDEQVHQLERDLRDAQQLIARNQDEIAELERQLGIAEPAGADSKQAADPKLAAELASLRSKVSRLSQEVAAKSADIERLKKALAALKEIDLGSPPP